MAQIVEMDEQLTWQGNWKKSIWISTIDRTSYQVRLPEERFKIGSPSSE